MTEQLIDSAVEERASEDDRLWFAARPLRSYRIRPRLAGELGAETASHTLVVQVRPGFRIRTPIDVRGRPPADDDAELARLRDLLAGGEPAIVRDGRVYSLAGFPISSRAV